MKCFRTELVIAKRNLQSNIKLNEVFEDRVSDGEEELAIKYKIECFNVKYVVNIYRSG